MKKEFNKIVLCIGFLTALVGFWISVFTSLSFAGLTLAVIAIVLSFAFINSSNATLKIVGYSFSAFLGAVGLYYVITPAEILDLYYVIDVGALIMGIGMIVMAFASVIYFFGFLLNYFGFVKVSKPVDKN